MKRVEIEQRGDAWRVGECPAECLDGILLPGPAHVVSVASANVTQLVARLTDLGFVVDLAPEEERVVDGKKTKVKATDAPAVTRAFHEAETKRTCVLVVATEPPPSSAIRCAVVHPRSLTITAQSVDGKDELAALHARLRPSEVVILRAVDAPPQQQLVHSFKDTGAKPCVRVTEIHAAAYHPDDPIKLRDVPDDLKRVVRGAFEFLDALRRMERFNFMADEATVDRGAQTSLTSNAALIDALSVGRNGEFVSPARSVEGSDLYRRRACGQNTEGSLVALRAFWDAVTQDAAVETARCFPTKDIKLAECVTTSLAAKPINFTNASVQGARDAVCGLISALKSLKLWVAASHEHAFPRKIDGASIDAALALFPDVVRAHCNQPKSWGWAFHPGHKDELAEARSSNNVTREYELLNLYVREWTAMCVVARNAVQSLDPRIADVYGEQDILIHARAQGWCVPTITGRQIDLEGFTPGQTGGTPVTFFLEPLIVVTGANESGKTTLLRTVAQCLLAAYAGLPVRADKCLVPPGLTRIVLWPAHRATNGDALEARAEGTLLLVDEFPKRDETVAQLIGLERFVVVTHKPTLVKELLSGGCMPFDVRCCSKDDAGYTLTRDVFLHSKRPRLCRAEELLDEAFA